MGNAQSEEEATGSVLGGFLGLLGGLVVSVICPPLAPVAIPAGFGAHGYGIATNVRFDNKPYEEKKQGTTSDFVGGMVGGATCGGLFQVGANYKDGDSRPHLHYCPRDANPIAVREEREIKEKTEKIINKVEEKERLRNETLKKI